MLRSEFHGKGGSRAGGATWRLSCLLTVAFIITVFALAGAPQAARGEEFLFKWGSYGTDGFNQPYGVAVDAAGNVYVADTNNHRIQKFDSNGGFIGKWGSQGTGTGQFNIPVAVAVDAAGNVYVADYKNDRIQKFTSTGAFRASWASNSPSGIAVDVAGNVYVADLGISRIHKFDSNGVLQGSWGSYGSGNGKFIGPAHIAVDGAGNVYVADMGNHRIQKFDSNGVFIATWGSQGTGDGQFYAPNGIGVDAAGNVYVADMNNHRIQKFDSSGNFLAKWGSGGIGDGQFGFPTGIAMDAAGNVYVADMGNHRIQKLDSSGNFVTKWGSRLCEGKFLYPNRIAVDASGDVYVADNGNDRIQKFDSGGGFLATWGTKGTGNGQFDRPWGVAVDASGNVFVADSGNYRIQKFDSNGNFVAKLGSPGDAEFAPFDVALDAAGNVYVADTYNYRIHKFDSNGNFLSKWGSFGPGNGQFNQPWGVAVDASGNVYVADTKNHRIQKFDSTGAFRTKFGEPGKGDGQLSYALGIAVDASGNAYVADTNNHRIQVFGRRPIANAGPDQPGHLGKAVTLDGSGSYDPDGNPLVSYAWEMASKPAGSSASLTVSDPIHPTFTPDAPGNYTVKLVVTDSLGRTSNPDEVIVSTANIAPVAYAGADQAIILMGSTVYLNGRGSQDDDGDPLTYSWTMTKPTGSNAILLNPTSQTPSFVVDLYGTYQVTLVVTDRWGAKSAPDTMLASFDNLPPLAQAVGNLAAVVGDMVLLDASASSDPNGDPLTYKWSLVSRPDGSLAGLSADTGLSTTFLVDVAGSYVVSLIANDGRVNSAPLNVTVAVITKQTETTQTLTEVVEAVNDPTTIPDSAFGNPNNRTPLTNKINAVIGMIDGGQYQQALDKLKTDILPKTDGCAVSGRPDNNDMIKTCPEQAVVYAWLTHAIAVLETMVPQP